MFFFFVIGKPQFVDVLSYAWHGIFTQPLQGKDYKCGLDMNTTIPCCSLNNVVKNVIYMTGKINSSKIGVNRVIAIPALSLSLNDLYNAMQNVVTKNDKYKNKIKVSQIGKIIKVNNNEYEATVKEINVNPRMSYKKAQELGLDVNISANEIICNFIDDYLSIHCKYMFKQNVVSKL